MALWIGYVSQEIAPKSNHTIISTTMQATRRIIRIFSNSIILKINFIYKYGTIAILDLLNINVYVEKESVIRTPSILMYSSSSEIDWLVVSSSLPVPCKFIVKPTLLKIPLG